MPVKIIQSHKAVGPVKPPEKRINWEAVRQDYFAQNMVVEREEPFTLKMLAGKWSISYGAVRNRSHKDSWPNQLQDLISQRSAEATARLKQDATFDEMEIRQRHARVARVAMAKAIARIQAVDATKLTVKEATDLLRLSLEQERRAAGIDDKAGQLPPEPSHPGFESPQAKIARIQRMKNLSDKLSQFLEDSGAGTDAAIH